MPIGSVDRDVIVALVAVGLGMQNAAVRSISVPDITTSVLTMTLTGIAADLRSHQPRIALRRALSVTAMLAGALSGALLVLDADVAAAMWVASAIVALVLAVAWATARDESPWQSRPRPAAR
jgi:uncharacterized membrane protein YoaK (UPF0700 family)